MFEVFLQTYNLLDLLTTIFILFLLMIFNVLRLNLMFEKYFLINF